MYSILTIREDVRVPPTEFGKPQKEAILQILRQQYEGNLSRETGIIVAITDVKEVSDGIIKPGDGAAYYPTKYKALVFKPQLHEVIEGIVIEIVEFGAFVNLGALDGLIHISQVTDDFLNYDEKGARLVGKESKKFIKESDKIRARIVAVSLKKTQTQKVGLTMRQPGLGKIEWLEEEEKKKEKEEKPKEKKKKKKGA